MLGRYGNEYEALYTINSVLNTSVKVSGGACHYLPRKVSLKLGASKSPLCSSHV